MPTPDFQQLASQVVAFLTPLAPYLALGAGKVAEGGLKKGGEDIYLKSKDLVACLRARFQDDHDAKAEQTLDLFLDDAATFEEAMTRTLAAALARHPDWADDLRDFLAQPSVQEVIARNSTLEGEIQQDLTGPGQQRVELDGVQLRETGSIKQTKR